MQEVVVMHSEYFQEELSPEFVHRLKDKTETDPQSAVPESIAAVPYFKPAILRGGRFTTNNACLPSTSRGFARSRFIPAKTVRQWSPKLTRSATSFSELATSLTDSIVPTRTSIWFRSPGEIVGFTLAGVTQQFYSAGGKPHPAGKNAIKVQTLKCQGRENCS